jgi:hypothetical protein
VCACMHVCCVCTCVHANARLYAGILVYERVLDSKHERVLDSVRERVLDSVRERVLDSKRERVLAF